MNRVVESISGIGESFVLTIESLFRYIRNNRLKIMEHCVVTILCLSPFLSLFVAYASSFENGAIMAVLTLALSVGLCLLDVFIRETEKCHTKRFTSMNEYGDIQIDEADLNEAIRFLYEIENKMGVK